MKNAPVLRVTEIGGITLRIAVYFQRLWICTQDLAQVLGYRSVRSVESALQKHAEMEDEHCITARLDGKGGEVHLCDEVAVYQLCRECNRPGARLLLQWMGKGGMHADWEPPLPIVEELSVEEIELANVEEQPKAPILALVPSKLPPVPSGQEERGKAYCRELLKTLLRYANDEETEHLVNVIEASVLGVLNVRYCQGLNDARYELYRRFWLQGGAK